jgi:hypothetical protein
MSHAKARRRKANALSMSLCFLCYLLLTFCFEQEEAERAEVVGDNHRISAANEDECLCALPSLRETTAAV